VRLSLGASRARIVRQLLTEATMLAVAGGAAGLMVCWWLLRLEFGRSGSVDGNAVMPDGYTLAWTMAIAIGTGILFGLSPALQATRSGVANALRDSGTGASRQSRLQRSFVIAQIVFSLPLLVMLGVTLSMLVADYRPIHPELSERVLRITFNPLQRTGPPGQRREAVDSLIPRIAAHRDITAVVPEASYVTTRRFRKVPLAPTEARDSSHTRLRVLGAAPGWLALLDIRILMGRDVALADTAERDWPVVISSELARALWHEASPIGRTLASIERRDSISMTVVGVYEATYRTTVDTDSTSVITAHGKEWRGNALLVRTRGDAEALMPVLRPMIRDLVPGLPVTGMRTLANLNEEERSDTIVMGSLIGGGGLLALLLASLGLYGVIALAVRQRTREIGIRIALGAEPLAVARMFLASGVRLGVIALVIGLPLCMAALRFVQSRFESDFARVDAWVIGAGVAVVLLAVTAAATWLPARRAAAVDPASTLRVE
jgi:predicted permease